MGRRLFSYSLTPIIQPLIKPAVFENGASGYALKLTDLEKNYLGLGLRLAVMNMSEWRAVLYKGFYCSTVTVSQYEGCYLYNILSFC